MRRSATFTLYGLAVAGLIGGCAVASAADRSVSVAVDGKVRHVRTTARTVDGVLHSAKLSVGAHDVVAPAMSAHIDKGQTIELRRGRLLHLTVDGQRRDVWTTAGTVDQALAALGLNDNRAVGVSRAKRLPLRPTSIEVVSPKRVAIRVDHKSLAVLTTAPTVAQAVAGAHVRVGPTDRIGPDPAARPKAGMTITVTRVTLAVTTRAVSVPYSTTKKSDPTQFRGYTKVLRHGRAGSAIELLQLVYVDGKLTERRAVQRTVNRPAVTQVQAVGTKKPLGNSPQAAQAFARQLLAKHHWGADQFQCLLSLWNKESHWNIHAANPSGAYGIPQALPGAKMSSAGPDWQNNAQTQVTWGLGYITSRYQTPCGAWGHSQATNWY